MGASGLKYSTKVYNRSLVQQTKCQPVSVMGPHMAHFMSRLGALKNLPES